MWKMAAGSRCLPGPLPAARPGRRKARRPTASLSRRVAGLRSHPAPQITGEVIGAYTVTFQSEGGSEVASQIRANTPADRPADPTKEGYTFIGWYNGESEWNFETPVTADLTLTAKWQVNQYTITFKPENGGRISSLSRTTARPLPPRPTLPKQATPLLAGIRPFPPPCRLKT